LGAGAGRLDGAARRLDPVRIGTRLDQADTHLHRTGASLRRATVRATAGAEAALGTATARVAAADPSRALARGWSLTRGADGRLVRRAGDLSPGEALVTTFASGRARSTVTDITTDEPQDTRR
jgi:exodeoxyribonuclease VII large subunit